MGSVSVSALLFGACVGAHVHACALTCGDFLHACMHACMHACIRVCTFVCFNFVQCSFVYPYPVPVFLTSWDENQTKLRPKLRPKLRLKLRTKTQTTPDSVFARERRNPDHGPRFWDGKSQTIV